VNYGGHVLGANDVPRFALAMILSSTSVMFSDERDLVPAAPQPVPQHGEGHVGARVADVHEVVDGGTAGVDADLALVASARTPLWSG